MPSTAPLLLFNRERTLPVPTLEDGYVRIDKAFTRSKVARHDHRTHLERNVIFWCGGTGRSVHGQCGRSVEYFTFKGAYSGTLKLTPSSFNCSYGKTYSGKGFLVTLSHMKGTITGAGRVRGRCRRTPQEGNDARGARTCRRSPTRRSKATALPSSPFSRNPGASPTKDQPVRST